jgi:hypothetical protein
MNRRKAKKAVKKKYHIKKWVGNISPRGMERIYTAFYEAFKIEFCKALEKAVLYGGVDYAANIARKMKGV